MALVVGLIFSSMILARRVKDQHLPGNQQGYEPVQPIAFSHKQHAGELQVSCQYCHYGAQTSPHAGLPAASICMSCHRFVTAPQKDVLPELLAARKANRTPKRVVAPELEKLYEALGLDLDQLEPDPNKKLKPIQWVKVHTLPAFTTFDHRPHVRAGFACQRCHGPVETMDRVRQVEDLSMGWCVNCHRESGRTDLAGEKLKASTDCVICHH
jgi:hypothetical protein